MVSTLISGLGFLTVRLLTNTVRFHDSTVWHECMGGNRSYICTNQVNHCMDQL